MAKKERILEHLSEALRVHKQEVQEMLESNEQDQQHLQTINEETNLIYKIEINSLWAHEGEKSITYTSQPPETIRVAMKKACAEFRSTNHRSDCQANVIVSILLPTKNEVVVPRKFWQTAFNRYKHK